MLRERSQAQRTYIMLFHLHSMSRKNKSVVTGSRLVGALGLGVAMGITVNGHEVFFRLLEVF